MKVETEMTKKENSNSFELIPNISKYTREY